MRQLRQLGGRGQAVRERGLVDQDPGAALRQHGAQARHLLADAERHGDRTEPLRREQGREELRPVAEQDGDPVAGADAERGKTGRGAQDQPPELPVGEAEIARDQRLALGVALERCLEDRRQVRRPVGEAAHPPALEMHLVADRWRRIVRPGHGQGRRRTSGGVR